MFCIKEVHIAEDNSFQVILIKRELCPRKKVVHCSLVNKYKRHKGFPKNTSALYNKELRSI